MSSTTDGRPAREIIEEETEAYLAEVPPPDPDWPPDVWAVYNELQDRLFEMGLEVQAAVNACGIGDHNVHSRFRYVVGRGMKEWVLAHRLRLGKRLLAHPRVPITDIAFAVGYENPSGFSTTFRRREGCAPSAY